MRCTVNTLAIGVLILTLAGPAFSGGDDGRAIVNKAINAGGGEAALARYESVIMKEKGTYYGMGDGLPYTSVIHLKRSDQSKMEIVGIFTMVINGDKGWTKSDQGVTDMTKEQLDIEQFNRKAGWIMSLLPLKDKAYTFVLTGNAKLDNVIETRTVKVSRKDYPSVVLYFDKKTDHLVGSHFFTRSSEQKGKEVKADFRFSDFKTVDGVTMPHHVVLKHDNKLYVEADVTEVKAAKLDAKAFAKPARD